MAESDRPRQEINVSFAALSGNSVGASVAQPYGNTSRMDWSTSIGYMDGRSGRSGGGGSRSRSQASVRADSFRRSEGRRMSQDTRRYMQAAAASTQTTVQQLLARLQSYQTFQPFLSHQVPYTSAGDEGQSRAASVAMSARQRSTDRAFSASQLWQVMNGLLDTSVAHLLQHNAEGHFIATLQSTLGLELSSPVPKGRTVIESRVPGATAMGSDTSTSAAALSTSQRQLSAASSLVTRPTTAAWPGDSNLLVDRWAAEHPAATAADIATQRDTWSAFEEQRRRDNRAFYLRAMQRQLDALQAEESGASSTSVSSAGAHSSDGRSRSSGCGLPFARDQSSFPHTARPFEAARGGATELEARFAISEEELAKEADRQRALWISFQEEPPATAAANGRVASQAPPDAPRIVADYLESADLHSWLQSSWPHRTHRHESAALQIQCAYRAYHARCAVRLMRYTRRQVFVVGLAAEKEARRVWDMALQVQADASKAVNGSCDGTMRALQFFLDKINAVVAKRRARKLVRQEQDAKICEYAAASIQRVYRGHRARVRVEELRHPEIVAARQRAVAEKSATVIQTSWRRHREELRWHRQLRAACTLQRAHRCHAARRLLAERRQLYAVAEVSSLRCFAVRRIELWYARHLAQRNAFAAAHPFETLILQRVGRGYLDRRRLGVELRIAALRGVAALVERRRRMVLDARAAVGVKTALAEDRQTQQHAVLCEDAAITIQRAWRSRAAVAPSPDQREEL
ncbi:hypothetical protein ABB37_08021 [Leptomonas pyrrhocoris]|uniref:IQ calmodulin-binding protein n=1 Tax=Leptomonas pyrrhocoris TaxID=157538 RepID=A0A0M9FUI3_LEPPY|nr:hypothetical protein ABB37_08021 [Leptomonas pyrrhocoris]XP_015654733.1 hypothetical protein ABB37_08021 [Leptomonas pyrrhocoris]KPA76293.1 hypothetical protein ABB37_08021 [Leptomonas pyrrhocoris]KPA76294.1 hypothetical protein ABB37_08021 [Leptomonas pyrrhocoris]|eukprot:XP_015654732.1 hypothetical protein ABB37_08021 [Leptomonas pyrrhocoris]